PLEIPVQVSGPALTVLNEYKPSSLFSADNEAGSAIPAGKPRVALEEIASFSWPVLVWLGGSTLFLAMISVQTLRASRFWSQKRLSTDPALLDLLEDCKARAGITTPIGLVVTTDIDSPALLGWLRPRILLPEKLTDPSSRHLLRAVFFHELAHFRNGDIPL